MFSYVVPSELVTNDPIYIHFSVLMVLPCSIGHRRICDFSPFILLCYGLETLHIFWRFLLVIYIYLAFRGIIIQKSRKGIPPHIRLYYLTLFRMYFYLEFLCISVFLKLPYILLLLLYSPVARIARLFECYRAFIGSVRIYKLSQTLPTVFRNPLYI